MYLSLPILALISLLAQSSFGEVTSMIDGKYVNKLPISVTNIEDSNQLHLQLIVPQGLCQTGLVKRVEGGFHKKSYMACEDLQKRESDKMLYIFYNYGKNLNNATELMGKEKERLTTKICSGYDIIYEESEDYGDYSQADSLLSCSDVKNNRKVVMLISFFAGKYDSSALHYDIRVPIEYPDEFAVSELLRNINDNSLSILKNGTHFKFINTCKGYQK
jgi:hypothetical protein